MGWGALEDLKLALWQRLGQLEHTGYVLAPREVVVGQAVRQGQDADEVKVFKHNKQARAAAHSRFVRDDFGRAFANSLPPSGPRPLREMLPLEEGCRKSEKCHGALTAIGEHVGLRRT